MFIPAVSVVLLFVLAGFFVLTYKKDSSKFTVESESTSIEWANTLHEINKNERLTDTGSILSPDLVEMREKIDTALHEFNSRVDAILDAWREQTWKPTTAMIEV